MQLQIDKEFQGLIPPLTEDEFQQLEANIIADGCRDALITWEGILIDGHNRYRICQESNIPFRTEAKEFPDRQAIVEWIIRNQFGRRNLTPFQRAELALKLKPAVEKKAKERQGARNDLNIPQKTAESRKGESRDELAAIAGISHDTLKKAEVIKEKGTPEQLKRAREGGKGNKIGTIYNEIATSGIETQVCASCGKELPIADFYANKRQCKACWDQDIKAYRQKAKEPPAKPPRETMKAMSERIYDEITDTTREVVYTIDDLVEELRANIVAVYPRVETLLTMHAALVTGENKPKIKAVLNEAATAIQNMKGQI